MLTVVGATGCSGDHPGPPTTTGCTTTLGSLGSLTVTRTGAWSAAGGCESSQRGNPQTPYYAKFYTFTLGATAQVTIDLSSDRDTYLYLLAGHGRGGARLHDNDDADSSTSDSLLSVQLAAGDYTIEATTYSARTTGSFTLTIDADIDGPDPVTISGLAASYTATVGEAVSFEFTFAPSAAVPSQPSVTPAELALALTHDSGTATVTGTATHADTYTATFEFTHRARTDTHTTITVACPAGRTQQPDRTCAAPVCTAPLGSIATGTLGPQSGTWERDCVLPEGRRSRIGTYYAKHYTFTLTRRAQVTIDLTSADEDTYLLLLSGHSPDGTELHHDDDSGTGRNSKLSVNLEAGDYTISASTYRSERTGSFQVRVQASEPAVCTTTLDSGTINSQTLTLSLERGTWEDSCALPSGRRSGSGTYYAKHYTFTLDADADITIDLTSDYQDAYLFLLSGHGPDGTELHRNDDSGTGRNSKLTDISLAAGDYTITSSTYSSRRTGSFQVRVEAVAPAACITDLGVLALEPVISGGVWSASSECVSLRRGSTGSPHYARYYTFTLEQYSNVTVDLEPSQNTYLYLLSGHGAGGRVRVQDGDADDTTPNTHVSLDLSQGVYTIEATTFDAEVEGSFTLVAVDPPLPNPVVGEPFSYGFSFAARWWSPWVHANMPWVQSVTPSTGLSLELTHRHHPTTRNIVVTVSDTPTHASDYTVTFAYLQSNGSTSTFTNRIRVDCPTETNRQSDRTCLENFVVAESDVPGDQDRYPVSFAALKGMRQAADDWVGKFQLNDNGQLANNEHCGVIPEEYRLTRNMLVTVLVTIQLHELWPSGQANSLMDLSRGDRYYFPLPEGETARPGNRVVNRVLYSLNDPSDEYGRAFWHPGVGLYQLDDANILFGSKLNHAERAHAKTSASTALAILHRRYCQRSASLSIEREAISHLNTSLSVGSVRE